MCRVVTDLAPIFLLLIGPFCTLGALLTDHFQFFAVAAHAIAVGAVAFGLRDL